MILYGFFIYPMRITCWPVSSTNPKSPHSIGHYRRYDLLTRDGGSNSPSPSDGEGDAGGEVDEGGDEEEAEESGGGATVKLKPWSQRKRAGLAADGDGRAVPLIDRAHRLMQLWRAGEVAAVDGYLDSHGLRRSPLFHDLLQALIELSAPGSEECSLLESISNHINAQTTRAGAPTPWDGAEGEEDES